MIDWTNHKMVLLWLKNNLEHYQYLTPEAIQIKNRMSWNNLESEEEIVQFGRDYEQFALLLEENPLTATDINGNSAAILADSFYFYFYTTKQNVILPIGLQIEMGILNTKEKARDFKERLSASVERWKKQYDTKGINMAKTPQADLEYEILLKKNPSEAGYAVGQIVLLAVIILCLYGNTWIFEDIRYGVHDLKSFVLVAVEAVSVIYLIKSAVWVAREKKRRLYIRAWKAQKQSDKMPRPSGFRTVEGLYRILEEIEHQNFKQNESVQKVYISNLHSVNIEDLKDIKNQKVLYTLRPIHLAVMILAAMCLAVCVPDYMPQNINTVKQLGEEAIYNAGIPLLFINNENQEIEDAIQSMGMKVKVKEDKTAYYLDIDKTTIFSKYQKGSVFQFIECVQMSNGDFFFHVINDEYVDGYVSVKRCRLKADKAVKISDIEVYGSDGKEKKNEDLKNMTDGAVLTFAEFHKGDVIKLTFQEEISPGSIYILNGTVNEKQESDGMSLAYIQAEDGKKTKVFFDNKYNENGYIFDLKFASSDTLNITIRDTTDNSDVCKISELMLCE